MIKNLKTTSPKITYDDYEYTISNYEITITKYLGSELNVVIPETIEGFPVVCIGYGAFISNTTLVSISLSNVSVIMSTAFSGCTSLISIIGNSVEKISSYAFYNCENLISITMPEVVYLESYSFANCSSLETISFPLTKEVSSSAFCNCTKLNDINVQAVETIGSFAFENCVSLKSISLSELTYIDALAFAYIGIKNIDFPKVEIINYEVFLNCTLLDKADLPSVTTIYYNAFMKSGVEEINLPKVTTLDNTAFYGCSNLEVMTLCQKLTSIGSNVFGGCPVDSLTIDYGNEDISNVTIDDWYDFAYRLTGLNVENITKRYIKNNLYIINVGGEDNEPPVITLNGDNPMTLEVGLSTYKEPGATITDNSGENVIPSIEGNVDTLKIGEYTVNYKAVDSSGNTAFAVRFVNVIDTTAPVITLNGMSPMDVEINSTLIDPGVTITDNSSEIITPIITDDVDTSELGQYSITYTAVDSSGNKSLAVRRVNVIDSTPPIITIEGPSTINIQLDTEYIEFGATVTDNYDKELSAIITGLVDITRVGEYTVYYDAIDSSGNKAVTATRTVTVTNRTHIKCSRLISYNSLPLIVKYSLRTKEGTQVYLSGNTLEWDTWKFELSKLEVPVGQELILRALPEWELATDCNVTFEYDPAGETVYCEVTRNHINVVTLFYRDALQSTATPPILKCAYFKIHNVSKNIVKWSFISNGLVIYTSDTNGIQKWWSLALSDINISPEVQFTLKANVMGGSDSVAYVTFQYDPKSNLEAYLSLDGDAFKTVVVYRDKTLYLPPSM